MKVSRVHLRTVDSTNSYAKQHSSTFDRAGITVITADEQTAGRGRLGRQWVSTGEDIKCTFAFAIPPTCLPTAYQLSPLLSIVARRTFSRHGIELGVKWPNDIIIGGSRKLGGILCEMESLPGGVFNAALGIGINVNSLPEVLNVTRPVWPLTTLRAETGREHSVTQLTDDLVSEFADALALFLASGFAPFQVEYELGSVLLHKRVRFTVSSSRTVEGVVSRIGEDGKLYITPDGAPPGAQPEGFLSGEVSGIELAPGNVVTGCV